MGTRSLAPTLGRLGGGCFGLCELSALNVPPHAIVASRILYVQC
jgi:hypothetical protein